MNTPVRQLGRVPNEVYTYLRSAAARAGLPFSRWAVDRLLAAAIAETARPPAAGTEDTECRPCSSPPTQ